MPALVNYGGDDDFYAGRSICSADSGLVLSIADVYCPPRKRSRVSAPYAVDSRLFDKERNPSIETLPDECLFEIFRRLPGAQERSASACVSKRWLMLLSSVRNSEFCRSNSPQEQLATKEVKKTESDVEMISADGDMEIECNGYLTRSLEGKKATDVRLAAIAVGTACRGGLGKLSVRGCNSVRGVTNNGLSAIAHGCPSLRALSLWNVPAIGDEGLFEIARECHSLEKLDLCQCPSISDKGLAAVAKNCPSLSALTIESCSNIGNESLQAIGSYCPKLQSITIKDCPLIGDQGVAGLLSSASVALTKVKLQVLNISDFSLAVIGHYGKSITNLVLTGLQNVSQKGFWVMGNAQGLRMLSSLTITSCRGTSDLSLEALGKGCPNLRQMCLRKCCFVSDNGLVAFAKAAGSLECLQLEECNRITETGILNALSNCNSKLKSLSIVKCMGIKSMPSETPALSPCESLRSLSIRSCPWFNSTSLALVGKLCPQLHHLDLSGLCGITDAALLPLLESCESLVKVNLSDCGNLTDKVIIALAELHGATLELLNLEGCKKVTDASLVAIADSCLFLNDLDVSKCSITDSGVAALSNGVHLNLQVLSLSGCSMVSNRSLPHLKKLGETLVGLNLQHCNSISSSSIERLVENLWRCDILS
ncbi:EIN3-binding F-box protein 1-like [Coffea eugenioides]|uniref:EIN3-binding F-box protein 1 n=1 Tax=Coffea arabica TaxID=13443 RepID=A0A6P6T3S9_COFAR|nr:EIN3-binding F-box protein 1-like [Coffea arabica]XP_027175202.1 EIN3-binding F-box protein 1-like [Coffea eugenioides]